MGLGWYELVAFQKDRAGLKEGRELFFYDGLGVEDQGVADTSETCNVLILNILLWVGRIKN